MSFKANISSEELMQFPLYSYNNDVVVVDTIDIFNEIKYELFLEEIWGFDTETKPSFKKGIANSKNVSLMQLSSSSKTYLFRLNKIGLLPELINFLSSRRFIKVGVALRDDLKILKKLHNFTPDGFVDLQSIAKEYGINELGLKKMAAIVLSIRISKSQQLSNWEADILSTKQIKYAATDSWISREIYIRLLKSEKMKTEK